MPHVADSAWRLRLPAPLGLHRSVMASDHLHYGVWSTDRPEMTLEEAQEALLERLLALLPPPPARVLHVECGLGLTSFRLAERGYQVTAEEGVPAALDHARRCYRHEALEFRASSLVDLAGAPADGGEFDALLAVEPTGELMVPSLLLARARPKLKEGGIVILAGEVAGGRAFGTGERPPTAADHVVAMGEHGYRPADRNLLSREAAATCGAMAERLLAAAGASELDASELAAAAGEWSRRAAAFATGRLGYQVLTARKDRHYIRAYRDGDEREIVPMFREVFGVERTLEHWHWKFRDCPFGRHLIVEAVTGEGALQGHYAGYPVPFYAAANGGTEFMSHQVGDTMTRLSARHAGLGREGVLARMSAYYFARFAADIPFVYGFNTGNIRKLGERYLGYEYIDPVARWAKPVAGGGKAATGRLRTWLQGYTVSEITCAGAELTEFFRRVRDSYDLLVRRDAEYLRWRYLECPDRVHRLLAIRRRGTLVGWSAFSRRGDDLVWGDALVDRRHVDAVPLLLEHCTRRLFPGVERVWGWFAPHPEWWTACLGECGFVREREPDDLTPCFFFLEDAVSKQQLAQRWYYAYGDSDLF